MLNKQVRRCAFPLSVLAALRLGATAQQSGSGFFIIDEALIRGRGYQR